MSIQIYNTLSREKEEFVPLEEGKVKMYVCGPTVYNYIHIGNARPAIVFDTVRRYLEFRGYDVNFVSNFTDVDDKLIRAANELGEEVPAIADRFIEAYFEDVTALGCKKADTHPRVTESMDIIIEFIEALIEKGYAYESEGDVYYHTRKFEGYGKLSHQSIDELKSGARIAVGEKKQDFLDFALWKNAKGGQDLAFPHHENEIAQSEALSGKTFANYWMHNGYINIDNEKMSKSLGNFITVHDILKIHDPQVLRFFMLSVHYRNPINYSEEVLENTRAGLERIRTSYDNLLHRKVASTDLTDTNEEWLNKITNLHNQFIESMDDDFNTANGISVLFELSQQANYYLLEKTTSAAVINAFIKEFEELFGVLGLSLAQEDLLDEEIEALIEKRNQARKERNFQLADQIRDQLKAMNIILEDTPQGIRWKRG